MRTTLFSAADAIASELENLDLKLNICKNYKLSCELEEETSDSQFWNDANLARQKLSEISNLRKNWAQWNFIKTKTDEVKELLSLVESESDPILSDIEKELSSLEASLNSLKNETIFDSPDDYRNCILTIHSGAGGTEAQDWASILLRMYLRFCQKKNYEVTIIDQQAGESKNLVKSTTLLIKGELAYGHLKVENGVHRLVRVSPFDAAKRRHTSFCSVFALPEIDDEITVVLNDADLRVDTYRSSGPGGQNVNKVETAVRITHLPTGIVAACESERSQQKNKENALKLLKAKLYNLELEKRNAVRQELENSKKKIEWGSQIRSYVFQPNQVVKDHRSGYEVSDICKVIDGDIEPIMRSVLILK